MTIAQTKKILGKLAENISDEQIKKEIEVAELLMRIYFSAPNYQSKRC